MDKMVIWLLALIIAAPVLVLAVSPTLNKMGNQVGNMGNNNSAAFSQQGNSVHGQDGSIYNRVGNTTYSNKGTVYYNTGEHTYASDGSYCTKIGAVTQCNKPTK
ncbi:MULTISPECIES: hypothetical protein [Basfia]|nr:MULTISPECIES: hypothetical protein [Basfia]SEP59815.1 hypothetical protein SAMN02910415_00148 [Basfia succiniciproducens]